MFGRLRLGARSAIRGARRSPAGALAVVVVLGAAVTADLAVVAVWRAVIERSWPFRSPETVVEVRVGAAEPGAAPGALRFAGPTVEEVAAVLERSDAFTWLGHYTFEDAVVGDRPDGASYLAVVVGAGLLDSLGTAIPVLGRSLTPEDHAAPGAASGRPRISPRGQPVVVVSHSFWTSVLGGSAAAVGREITYGGAPMRVIGVLPPDFFFPIPEVAMWMPLRDDTVSNDYRLLGAARPTIGRLAPGVSPEAAARELAATVRSAELSIRRGGEVQVIVRRFGERSTAAVRPALVLLRVGGWLFVLAAAVSCAGLRLLRNTRERRSIQTRFVLGASFLDEVSGTALRIAAFAAAAFAGAALTAPFLLRLFRRLSALPADVREWSVGPGVLLSGLATTILIAALSESPALAARLRLRRNPLAPAPFGGAGGRRMLRGLLAAGIALATSALTLTALLGTNARALLVGRGGYSDENLVQVSVDFSGRSPNERAPHREKINALERAAERLLALPIVEAAGYADSLPDDRAGRSVRSGRAQRTRNDPVILGRVRRIRAVSPGLFGVLGIPIREGRGFHPSDDPPGERVIVVDRNLVTHSDEPVRIDGFEEIDRADARVVGITEPVREFPSGSSTPVAYHPIAWEPRGRFELRRAELVTRLRSPPSEEQIESLATAVSAVHPLLRIRRAETVRQRRLRALGMGVLVGAALGAFGVAGLLLAALGVVGNVLDEAAAGRKSAAIRRALGASQNEVVRETLRRTATALATGAGLGAILGFIASRLVASRVTWVEAGDPFVYLAPMATVLLLGGAAALFAARRGVRAEPWTALRSL